ncbi:MAG: hypothetical protein OXH47_02890 [Paracoccaceae bacterium]|nr:hypothetical protein [Paracoccaceae bacterium]
MHTVVETAYFIRQADDLLGIDERYNLLGKLALNPGLGALIPDLGGVRKLRIPAS